MYYLIYKITNTINNKIYIGKHKTHNKDDDYFGSGTHLKRAIKKYGEECFMKEILFECHSEEEMNQKEAELVNQEFVDRKDTYNIKLGGQGGFDYINNSGKNLYGRNGFQWKLNGPPKYDLVNILKTKGRYDEYINKISSSLKVKYASDGHPWEGRNHTDETKKKMSTIQKSIARNAEKNHFYKSYIVYDVITGEQKRCLASDKIPNGYVTSNDYKFINRKISIILPLITENIVKVKQENVVKYTSPTISRYDNEKLVREELIVIHKRYQDSGCKSLREFCRNGHYKHSVQSLIMKFKKYIPDVYQPIHGKAYK